MALTKTDIQNLISAMKEIFATREDLKGVEERMATKEDLKQVRKDMAGMESRMATKEDLKSVEERMATKEDLASVEARLTAHITKEISTVENNLDEFSSNVLDEFERMNERIDRLDTKIDDRTDALSRKIDNKYEEVVIKHQYWHGADRIGEAKGTYQTSKKK